MFDDENVCPVVDDYHAGIKCDTCFKYLLENDRGRKTADRGLSNFYMCISHVLAFNPKFKSVIVSDSRSSQMYN